jgi:MFS family permease
MAERATTDVSGDAGDPPARRAWLTHNLKLVSAISLLQDTASEMLYPVLPVFITVVLGAPVAVLGTIEGFANGLSAIVSPLAGRAADRWGRRPLIGAGYSLAALGKLLVAVATAWPMVMVARGVDRFGKGMRGAPRDALIADGVPVAQRGKAFGFHRMMDTAGAALGPLIGLVAYEALHHRIRPLLWIAIVPAVLSAALVLFVREPRRERAAPTPPPSPTPSTLTPLPPAFRRMVSVLVIFSLVNFPDALLLLRLHDIGFSVAMTILAYVSYNMVYALASYPAGALSDRLSRSRIYAVGLSFFALGYLGLGLTHNHVAAWLLLCVYGMFAACTDGVGKAWASSLVGHELQGRAQGVYQGATGLAIVAAGVWAGFAWHGSGVVPLLISGAISAFFALWLWIAPIDQTKKLRDSTSSC